VIRHRPESTHPAAQHHAHRLGARKITSVEIDPDLAEHVRRALTATGYPVTVITGDGAQGYPLGAPYDRIISTAAVRQVPPRGSPRPARADRSSPSGERHITAGR